MIKKTSALAKLTLFRSGRIFREKLLCENLCFHCLYLLRENIEGTEGEMGVGGREGGREGRREGREHGDKS